MTKKIIQLIDNTKTNSFSAEIYAKGYTEYKQLCRPNAGIELDTGDVVHFFTDGLILAGDNYLINNDHIFLRNGYLQRPGMVCKRHKVNVVSSLIGADIESQEFWRVIDSNIPEILDNSLVVTIERTSTWFNFGNEQLYFIPPDKAFLVVTAKGISAGPEFVLLETYAEKDTVLLNEKEIPGIGQKNGMLYYFSRGRYKIKLNHRPYWVVEKKNIKLIRER